ncbi:MAG: CotH kinase family protein [Myxococcales bacterium]|nr:CotH kinase family protein [Myxococcales bacterium]
MQRGVVGTGYLLVILLAFGCGDEKTTKQPSSGDDAADLASYEPDSGVDGGNTNNEQDVPELVDTTINKPDLMSDIQTGSDSVQDMGQASDDVISLEDNVDGPLDTTLILDTAEPTDVSTPTDTSDPKPDIVSGAPDAKEMDINDNGDGSVEDIGADNPDTTDITVEPDVVIPPLIPPPVTLNEVQCAGDDWVELVNLDPNNEVSLAGVVFTDTADDISDPAHAFTFPDNATISPGGHWVLYKGEDSFPFGLSCDNDTIALVMADGGVFSELPLVPITAGTTFGRYPDATGEFTETAPTPGSANQLPIEPGEPIYHYKHVPTIEITMSDAAYQSLAAAPKSWVSATVQWKSPEQDDEERLVWLRIKGNYGSLQPIDKKAAFKVEFQDGPPMMGPLQGLSGLTLNNMVQDGSMVHEQLAYALFRGFEVASPRTAYVWVRVNGKDYGLYANVEVYDERFLAQYFPSTAHLFEGQYGTDLIPAHVDNLDVDMGSKKDLTDIQLFTYLATATPDSEWLNVMETVADMEQMMRVWAIEQFIGHWDGYAPTINNYYVHSDQDGIFSMLPWGTDQTFSSWLDYHSGKGYLFARCMQIGTCRMQYDLVLSAFASQVIVEEFVTMIADAVENIYPYVFTDPKKSGNPESTFKGAQASLVYLQKRLAELKAQSVCGGNAGDEDNDGVPCGWDCDDADPLSYPGAPEICGDKIDQDCNGKADDGLTCPDCTEVFRGPHRYLVCTEKRTYSQGRTHCQSLGADLVIVNDVGENTFLHGLLGEFVLSETWIGYSDAAVEGSWKWWDGTAATYTKWNAGEPNNAGNEDCAALYPANVWNDLPCEAALSVICEDLCTTGQDDDKDGAQQCGTDCDDSNPLAYPGAAEVCGDIADNDCNGKVDDGAKCPACTPVSYAGHQYWKCMTAATQAAAQTSCVALGGGLVVLESAQEAQWLNSQMGGQSYWIGLTDIAVEGKFVWNNGAPVTYTNWAPGEPNNANNEDCVQTVGNYQWNDIGCTVSLVYMCEEPCTNTTDFDQDGVTACQGDCDDQDPETYAGAKDLCGDMKNQDCVGTADDDPLCGENCGPVSFGTFAGLVCKQAVTQEQAKEICTQYDMQLAWFDSLAEQFAARAIMTFVIGKEDSNWIGLTDLDTEGSYVWQDGLPIGYVGWKGGQPAVPNADTDDCVAMDTSGMLMNSGCHALRLPLCR